ncbi:MAG: glycosyltransferase family 1 protein [Bacteroidota bacterium]
MPSVLVDIYKTKDINSGLGQFSYHFARAISGCVPKDFDLNFLIPKGFDTWPGESIHFQEANFQHRYLPALNRRYDLWHALHQFPSHLPNKHSPFILTIHDLNFLLEKSPSKAASYLKTLQKNVDRAAAITVISDYSKNMVSQHLTLGNKPLFRIYNGVQVSAFPAAPKPDFVKNGSFFFSLGIISAKKNFHTLLPIMNQFKDFQLIIAGNKNTAYAKAIEKQIQALHLEDQIILPGKITEQEKYWLYAHCKAFLFPSLAEGFGLPMIEAMLLGKPVFASTHTCLPEIGGDFAFYWEDFNSEYMAEVLKTKLAYFDQNHAQLSEKIRTYAQKFSWQHCIQQYLELYQAAINGKM